MQNAGVQVFKAYGRYWSVIWFGLASPVPIAAGVAWSWVGVLSMTMVALLLGSVIFGNPPSAARGRRGATRRIPWRLILVPAFRWAVIAVAVVLTTVFSPWLGVLVLTALVGSSPWAVRRVRGSASRGDDPSRDQIREAVRQLDLAGLCWAWRSSHELLARIHDVDARTRVVTLRQEYLDEMERRDARGFQEWLEVARGASDPEVFLTERRDGGAAAA